MSLLIQLISFCLSSKIESEIPSWWKKTSCPRIKTLPWNQLWQNVIIIERAKESVTFFKLVLAWHTLKLNSFLNCIKWFFQCHLMSKTEKAMAPHSSTLAWRIPWMEEACRLQSMGSQRVGHDWATSLSVFTFMHWRRKWQPTPVFLPGESQGRGRLVGCRLWGRTESDTTEVT